jgi:hypothetical protein
VVASWPPAAVHAATPAYEFADDRGVADVECGPENVGWVLVGVPDDDDRHVRRNEPTQPGGVLLAQRDGDRAGDVPGGVVADQSYVDGDCPVAEQTTHLRRVEAGRAAAGW